VPRPAARLTGAPVVADHPTTRRTPLYLAASGALTAAVALLSLIPGTPQEGDSQLVVTVAAVPSALQNAMHLVLYGTLMILWSLTVTSGGRRLVLVAALLVLYGIALELCQLAVPGRFASTLDALLNSAGVLLGLLLLAAGRRVRPGTP
jgi:VanZ family protein